MLNTPQIFFFVFCSLWRAWPFISIQNEINNLSTEPAVNGRMNSQEACGGAWEHYWSLPSRTQPPLTSKVKLAGIQPRPRVLVDAPVVSILNTWAESIHKLGCPGCSPGRAAESPSHKKLITSSSHQLKRKGDTGAGWTKTGPVPVWVSLMSSLDIKGTVET